MPVWLYVRLVEHVSLQVSVGNETTPSSSIFSNPKIQHFSEKDIRVFRASQQGVVDPSSRNSARQFVSPSESPRRRSFESASSSSQNATREYLTLHPHDAECEKCRSSQQVCRHPLKCAQLLMPNNQFQLCFYLLHSNTAGWHEQAHKRKLIEIEHSLRNIDQSQQYAASSGAKSRTVKIKSSESWNNSNQQKPRQWSKPTSTDDTFLSEGSIKIGSDRNRSATQVDRPISSAKSTSSLDSIDCSTNSPSFNSFEHRCSSDSSSSSSSEKNPPLKHSPAQQTLSLQGVPFISKSNLTSSSSSSVVTSKNDNDIATSIPPYDPESGVPVSPLLAAHICTLNSINQFGSLTTHFRETMQKPLNMYPTKGKKRLGRPSSIVATLTKSRPSKTFQRVDNTSSNSAGDLERGSKKKVIVVNPLEGVLEFKQSMKKQMDAVAYLAVRSQSKKDELRDLVKSA
eukprot:CAMPEP_0201548384 /NCGR_PEP_ID=MMETSP0173_2-20130828/4914_1 /ASSEMBLY_ACC=CAM_ASM_000268 /TAXON_ID=218659 /ORGANISM="Vexillifera sp., Strain DIVA3 564/2" /LENGTH=455 /DNA_ID=CAMNT_0047957745 /DNA_START=57 /DNA_END=1420 /DNA_ORIENTATION=+